MRFFDPDRNWKSPDKRKHALLFYVVAALLTIFWPVLEAAVIAWLLGVALELGQWDTAKNLYVIDGIDNEMPALGQPGYGFGPLDIVANTVGITAWLITYALVRAIA